MRFFFCRFLLESAVGLFLICGVVLRLSIWIFYISKIQMGGIYGEICTKKGIYQRKWRLCGIILHGVLPLQGIRPDLRWYGYQALASDSSTTTNKYTSYDAHPHWTCSGTGTYTYWGFSNHYTLEGGKRFYARTGNGGNNHVSRFKC